MTDANWTKSSDSVPVWLGVLVIATALLLGACAGDTTVSSAEPATPQVAPDDVNKLFVVDCLLPPQVRKVGQTINYLAPRRPIKTTAIDCEIRGGEYVAFDRADYATSLKVWLPKAQEGDAEAQTLVGEIYEKGLGIQPDYQAAAVWYQKAADQNYARAQINLGQLYEKGQGVEKDLVKAMGWYRRASGLDAQGLQFISSVEIAAREAEQAELKDLRELVEQQKEELEKLKQEAAKNQSELDKARQQSKQKQNEVAQLRQKLEEERGKQPAAGAPSADATKRIQDLERQLKDREREDQVQQALIAKLETTSASYQSRLKSLSDELSKKGVESGAVVQAMQKEIDEKNREVQEKNRQIAALQAQVGDAQTKLNGARAKEKQMALELEQERKRAADERVRAEKQGQPEGKPTSLMNDILKELREKELALTKQRADIRDLESELNQYRQQSDQMKTVLAMMTQPPSIEIIDPPLLVTRSIPTAVVTAPVTEREIYGRVKAPAGLYGFSVNTSAQTVGEDGTFRVKVPISGPETRVFMVAADRRGRLAKLDILVSAPNAAQPKAVVYENPEIWNPKGIEWGTYYALIIGNEINRKMPRLASASQDAREVERVLRDRYGFKTVRLENATRYDIMTAMNKIAQMVTEKDNVLVYYAGHGNYRGDEGYWLPADAEFDNDANWIPVRQVTERLALLKAKHLMVVVDSCYSGAMSRSAIARYDTTQSPETREKWARQMLRVKSRTVLTSGGLKPVLDKGEGKNSIFAQSFLEALEANNGVLEGYRLYNKLYDNVVQTSTRLGLPQEPSYAPIRNSGHESGTFFFVPTRGT
jgi:hypothetical protein